MVGETKPAFLNFSHNLQSNNFKTMILTQND